MEKYLVAWENGHNAFLSWSFKTGYTESITYTTYTWLVRMVALLLHEEAEFFLEFRKNRDFLSPTWNLWLSNSGVDCFHSEQPILYQQENDIFPFHLPTVSSRNVKTNLLHTFSPISEFSLSKWILLAILS